MSEARGAAHALLSRRCAARSDRAAEPGPWSIAGSNTLAKEHCTTMLRLGSVLGEARGCLARARSRAARCACVSVCPGPSLGWPGAKQHFVW